MTPHVAAALMSALAVALPPLTPQTQAFIAPVHAAYARVEAEQAALPPPRSDAQRLERLYDLDQSGREPLEALNFQQLPADQRAAAMDAVGRELTAHDLADQAALRRLIPAEGWFRRSLYGEKASTAAFLIVQHATNVPALMRSVLPKLRRLAAQGEVDAWEYAYLYDRVALTFDHKPQRYGSQVECSAGVWRPQNLEDPTHVDQRRAAVGLKQTEAAYLEEMAADPCS